MRLWGDSTIMNEWSQGGIALNFMRKMTDEQYVISHQMNSMWTTEREKYSNIEVDHMISLTVMSTQDNSGRSW